ncbi:MAG: hypothetical protein ACSHWW_06450 [Nonlabens sp.]
MTALNNDKHVLILFYNSEIKNHKEILAYTVSAEKDCHTIDISKTKVTGTVWADLADLMNITVPNLIDTSHSTFENRYGKGTSLDADDTIKILQKDPEMLLFPILVKGNNVKVIKTYNEVLRFHESDTAGIEKTPLGKKNEY